MKKIFYSISIILLLSAGCNSQTNTVSQPSDFTPTDNTTLKSPHPSSAISKQKSYSDPQLSFTYPLEWQLTKKEDNATDYNIKLRSGDKLVGLILIIAKPSPSDKTAPQNLTEFETINEQSVTSGGGILSNKKSFNIGSYPAITFNEQNGQKYGTVMIADNGKYYIEAVFQSPSQADLDTFQNIITSVKLN